MSTSPDNTRTADRLVTLLSRWLAGHAGDAELRREVEAVTLAGLPDEHAEAIEELQAELRDPDGHPGELKMIVRETLEALAL